MVSGFGIDIFCRVVDNFGDVGVCWRLARQLVKTHSVRVRLWIDDLTILRKICSGVKVDSEKQIVCGVMVMRWPEIFPLIAPSSVPDVVVEGFGCRLPESYVSAMTGRQRKPVWVNMEYLATESWAEDYHQMASPQPTVPLTKYFFFPGFTSQTGGLFREAGLFDRRRRFLSDNTVRQSFLERLGVDPADGMISLFCYDNAPVTALFERLSQQGEKRALCLVPEGVASVAVSAFLGQDAKIGVRHTKDALTVQVIPIVDQDDYDRLLWLCDLNFVRGEDSFLRAQWAAKPFVWQIYPQDKGAHVPKLEAFLARYLSGMSARHAETVRHIWQTWNSIPTRAAAIPAPLLKTWIGIMPEMASYGERWADKLGDVEDFASSLIRFAGRMR